MDSFPWAIRVSLKTKTGETRTKDEIEVAYLVWWHTRNELIYPVLRKTETEETSLDGDAACELRGVETPFLGPHPVGLDEKLRAFGKVLLQALNLRKIVIIREDKQEILE